MGAKSPVKLKLRRPMFKCNICHRKLLSAQALKTHQYSIHKIESPSSTSRTPVRNAVKAKTEPKKVPAPVSKVNSPINKSQSSMHANDNSDDEARVLAPEKVSDLRKVMFECPQCNSVFPAYFTAFKHIQKYHCVNSKGQEVHATSSDLIKPLRVETCVKCNKRVRANDMHVCCETGVMGESGLDMDYVCMGCKQKFGSIQLFDLHVSGLHSDGVESLFFPDMSEFLSWKSQMQIQTKTIFLILGKCNLKQTYRCTYLPPSETTGSPASLGHTSQICPASIVVQEFTKGIQVHFYKNHHGHKCPDYVCPENYKRYLITSLMKQKDTEPFDVVYNEKDLYCQFKVLLESIIVEAAKVKVDYLKLLIEKALEMTSILNNYDEDDDTYTYSNKKSMCEEQISKALEILKGSTNKRKANSDQNVSIDHKKKKDDDVTPKIVNSFSMASKNEKEKKDTAKKQVKLDKEAATKVDIKKEINVPSPRILRNTQIQSPTFNDTYKDFVDKNFKPNIENHVAKPPSVGRFIDRSPKQIFFKTPPVENGRGLRVRPLSKLVNPTEIEEELAKDIEVPAPSPMKSVHFESQLEKALKGQSSDVSRTPVLRRKENKGPNIDPKENKGPNIDPKVAEKNAEGPKSEDLKIKALPKSKALGPKFEDAKTKAVGPNTEEVKAKGLVVKKQFVPKVKPKKEVMKTKIGQFKPSVSPKSSPSPKKSDVSLNSSIGKRKPDVEYEVMEQENDCNILILKI